MRVLHVPAHGPAQLVDSDGGLTTMQRLVGGYIEAIGGESDEGVQWTAYLDEEGKLKGSRVNRRANIYALAFGWRSLPHDVLVGDVVFCGPPDDDEGVDTDVPPELTRFAELARLPDPADDETPPDRI